VGGNKWGLLMSEGCISWSARIRPSRRNGDCILSGGAQRLGKFVFQGARASDFEGKKGNQGVTGIRPGNRVGLLCLGNSLREGWVGDMVGGDCGFITVECFRGKEDGEASRVVWLCKMGTQTGGIPQRGHCRRGVLA